MSNAFSGTILLHSWQPPTDEDEDDEEDGEDADEDGFGDDEL